VPLLTNDKDGPQRSQTLYRPQPPERPSRDTFRNRIYWLLLFALVIVVAFAVGHFFIQRPKTTATPAADNPEASTGQLATPPMANKSRSEHVREETNTPDVTAQKAQDDGQAGRPDPWMRLDRLLIALILLSNCILLTVLCRQLLQSWRRPQPPISAVLDLLLSIQTELVDVKRRLPKSEVAKANDSRELSKHVPPPGPPAGGKTSLTELPIGQKPAPISVEEGFHSRWNETGPQDAAALVEHYCREGGMSGSNLLDKARALGLQCGSPSKSKNQRRVLGSPDQDSRLLAIKDQEGQLFILVDGEQSVTEVDWLDLFQPQGFTGMRPVRTKRAAVIDGVSGEIQKGELEVLTAT
jgi:hypothetical protein